MTPLGIQDGAKKVASVEKIIHVQLDKDSTCDEYICRFLNMVMVGLTDHVTLSASDTVTLDSYKIEPEQTIRAYQLRHFR